MMDLLAAAAVTFVVAISVIFFVALAYAKYAYNKLPKSLDVDSYVGRTPSAWECLQFLGLRYYTNLSKDIHSKPYEIVAEERDVQGLKVTRRAKENEKATMMLTPKKKPPIIVGTIRMGFGHHRIAYGTSSWAISPDNDREVYFHDIVNIDGAGEASLIHEADILYSLGSRMATEGPRFIESLWGNQTSGGGGNDNALRIQCRMAELMTSLVSGLDKNSPFISTHPLVGALAVSAGFKNVINLVVDNHAQWFVVVPGALNLIQGPSLYQDLLKMGVPKDELELAGHWCNKELVNGIPEAVDRRIERIRNNRPLRLLIPVGGAGAQKDYLTDLVKACAPLVKEGKLQLFLNAGDHSHMKEAFEQQLDECKIVFDVISDVQGMRAFKDYLSTSRNNDPKRAVTLFAYSSNYPAVATTDSMCNVSDVLVCKPSEMAFYCLPKLLIRRVGDHEAKSAIRAAELGDGTFEARTVQDAMKNIDLFLTNPSILINMNKAIEKNNSIGIYDGCKFAIEKSLTRAAMTEQ